MGLFPLSFPGSSSRRWRSGQGLGRAPRFLLREAEGAVNFFSASDELKNKTVCEDQELKLHCHPSKFLNIYSASYGRRTQERDTCASEAERLPPFGMWLHGAISIGAKGIGTLTSTWIRGKVKGREEPPQGTTSFCPTFPNLSIV